MPYKKACPSILDNRKYVPYLLAGAIKLSSNLRKP
jgi:hypothetical protein